MNATLILHYFKEEVTLINNEIMKRLELVLFDFDDTLAVHTNHVCRPSELYLNAIHDKMHDPWETAATNKQLATFMHACVQEGKRVGLISATESYLASARKVEWVNKNYNVLCENYCVGEPEFKLQEMLAIATANDLAPDQVAVIDDYWLVLEAAASEGFIACSPLEIVNYIDNYPDLEDFKKIAVYKGGQNNGDTIREQDEISDLDFIRRKQVDADLAQIKELILQ